MHRQRRLVREELEEIGRRPLERDFQGLVVDGAHAELIDRHRLVGGGGVDRLGILDRIEDRRIARRGCRVLDAAEGEDEIVRGDRVAVRPFGVGAQLERIGQAIVGDRPAFGDAGNNGPGRVIDGQALVQILEDVRFDVDRGMRLIEGLRLAAIAAVEHDLGDGCRRCKHNAGKCKHDRRFQPGFGEAHLIPRSDQSEWTDPSLRPWAHHGNGHRDSFAARFANGCPAA